MREDAERRAARGAQARIPRRYTEADLVEIERSLAPALACGSEFATDTAGLIEEVRSLRKRVAHQQQAIMEQAIEHDSDMQEMRRYPPPVHAHGSEPWNDACADCQRESYVFERECRESDAAKYKAEIERLQDAWFRDETIAPDGELRATVSRTIERAAKAEALLFRIHTLTDPNGIERGNAERSDALSSSSSSDPEAK